MKRFITCLAVAAFVVTASVSAQLPGCDTGGNLVFTVNGNGPDANSQVVVNPGTVANLDFSDGNAGNAIIVLATLNGVVCNTFATPWGGSIDVAAPQVFIDGLGMTASVLDGLANSNFAFSFTVPSSAAGLTGLAFQAVHQDPTAAPFPFDNTVAIELSIPTTAVTTVPGTQIPDDGFFTYNAGNAITFYGVTYNQFFVSSNGLITFNAGSGDFSPTTGEFFNGVGGATNPAVAPMWGDYNRANMQGTYVVTEDYVAQTTMVEFQNQNWWDSQTPAGSFSATFGALGAGSLTIDNTLALAGVAGTDQDPIIGVSNGDAALGTQSDPGVAIVGYSSPGADDSVAHQYAGAGTTDPLPTAAPTTWLDTGAGVWTIF